MTAGLRAEQEHGRVRPLYASIPEICRWGGAWRILSDEGWLRIDDVTMNDSWRNWNASWRVTRR